MRRCAVAIARAVVAFLDAFLMGCFLSCFRLRPRPAPGSGCRNALVPRDQEGEVLPDNEQDSGKAGRFHEGQSDGGGIDEEELRRELLTQDNYLKLCGTISEPPAELQNESCEISLENANKCNNMPTDVTDYADCAFLSEAKSYEGCSSEEHYILSPDLNAEDTQDFPGVESVPHVAGLEKTPFLNIRHKLPDHSISPFLTPSVLNDDMQTPGTIYTSHRGVPVSGKRVRTRKQFIYPVLRPIENKLHHLESIEDTSAFPLSNPPKGRILRADYSKKTKQTYSSSVTTPGFFKSPPFSLLADDALFQEREPHAKCQIGIVEQLDEGALSKSGLDENHVALSLSRWMRPSSTENKNQGDVKCAVGDKSYDECSLLTELPVFMPSDLIWDVENPTPWLPKTWDGNGIPNTNTRYKEDTKVIWHATPFEERLRKALSNEEIRSSRVARGELFHPDENAE